MKCPHCLVEIHESWQRYQLPTDCNFRWWATTEICPACGKLIVRLVPTHRDTGYEYKAILVLPKQVTRDPPAIEVPDPFAQDYREACLVLNDSPKASAALSRRCLQHLLREKAGIKPGTLADEIQQVLDSKQLPAYLAEAVDGIRIIGNFAAHPIKSTSTGEIVDVEPGEADWILDTLEGLFDFYFVQPAKLKEKRNTLNKKLKDAGKPEMK